MRHLLSLPLVLVPVLIGSLKTQVTFCWYILRDSILTPTQHPLPPHISPLLSLGLVAHALRCVSAETNGFYLISIYLPLLWIYITFNLQKLRIFFFLPFCILEKWLSQVWPLSHSLHLYPMSSRNLTLWPRASYILSASVSRSVKEGNKNKHLVGQLYQPGLTQAYEWPTIRTVHNHGKWQRRLCPWCWTWDFPRSDQQLGEKAEGKSRSKVCWNGPEMHLTPDQGQEQLTMEVQWEPESTGPRGSHMPTRQASRPALHVQAATVPSTLLQPVEREKWLLLRFHLTSQAHFSCDQPYTESCREGNSRKHSFHIAKLTQCKAVMIMGWSHWNTGKDLIFILF